MTTERDDEIYRIAHRLTDAWRANPSLRLGQLVVNLLGREPYYTTDADAERAIEAFAINPCAPVEFRRIETTRPSPTSCSATPILGGRTIVMGAGPVEIVPFRMRRTEVQRPGGWTVVPSETIRIGDAFRMFESDGTPVAGGAVFECVSDPGENWGMEVK